MILKQSKNNNAGSHKDHRRHILEYQDWSTGATVLDNQESSCFSKQFQQEKHIFRIS